MDVSAIPKTTAIVTSRLYVPYGWIAIEYCDIDFTGENQKVLSKQWHDIEFSEYDKHDVVVRECKDDIKTKKEEIEAIRSHTKTSKLKWKIWRYKEYQKSKKDIRVLEEEISELKKRKKHHKEKRFKSAVKLHSDAMNFLKENGFLLVSSSDSGGECITTTEIWMRY